MTFTTPAFLLFLAVVWLVYWRLQRPGQNRWLLAASLWFYGWWDPALAALMVGVAASGHLAALRIAGAGRPAARRAWFAFAVLSHLGVLGYFKYANFFASSFVDLLGMFGVEAGWVTLKVVLPVGISFYTFQSFSYVLDVRAGRLPPVRSLADYLAFITFFPQLVAGPIERAQNLLSQISAPRRFDSDLARDGLRQMLWGFAKKMLVADRLAPLVQTAYANPASASGPELLFATVCFAIQIYADFSAYSDIAIGTARLFGFSLMRNFAFPCFAQDIPEFWRRWHISLSSWFRDYVYIPLGGNRGSRAQRVRNVLAVFVLSGLWHGANWNFLIWGLLHGLLFLTLNFGHARNAVPGGQGMLPSPAALARMLLVFAVVNLAWVFFRAASFEQACVILERIFTWQTRPAFFRTEALPALVAMLTLLAAEWAGRAHDHPLAALARWPVAARWAVYHLLVFAILAFAPLGETPFIYFQF